MQMKRERREYRINRVSLWWTLGVFLVTMVMGTSATLAEKHPDSLWRYVSMLMVLLYGGGIVWFCEVYQKMLDERIRIRNAEAARITGSWAFALSMTYMLGGKMLGFNWPNPDLHVLALLAAGLYALVYFILWLRSR
ncbi:hypothetical protein [Deinococcus misasensis]|uniref:hypothetical protein n=1 Tax=Deinococcus misasensis TaxID=392413 RepID=UPI000558C2A5|nr:hypothetical protein [Deinococcus misasensis]